MGEKKILECHDLHKKFGKKEILKGVSLEAEAGDILGFIGPNGAGKTTTIKLILGLQSITSGTVKINGYDVEKDFTKAIKGVGTIVENPDLYMYMSGYDNLKMIANLYDGITKERIDEVIKLVGLENRIHDRVSKYSLGMRQRLGVAQAILHKPNLLVLDEPTNGLDPKGILELRNLLKSFKDKTIIISSHLISEIEKLSTDIIFINNKTTQVKSIDGFRKIRSFRLGKKVKISNELVLSDEEVNVYVRKFVKENIPVYAVNESSGLENMLISMMEAK